MAIALAGKADGIRGQPKLQLSLQLVAVRKLNLTCPEVSQ